MNLHQTYLPDFCFCTMCGKECKGSTCSSVCKEKLQIVRNIIDNQKEAEKGVLVREWTEKTIRQFNRLQEAIK